jgi:hypothetical protein
MHDKYWDKYVTEILSMVAALLFALNTAAPQSTGIQPYEHNPNGDTWPAYDKPTIPTKKYSHNPKGDTWPAYD